MKSILTFFICTLFITLDAQAQNFWNLPIEISDSNTTISFNVDSTWHMVKGTTKNIKGQAWLGDKKDFRSIKGEVTLKVADFDTDSRSRDKRMREVMHADDYPDVRFIIKSVDKICDPQSLEIGQSCETILNGKLTIGNTAQELLIPAQTARNLSGYTVSGEAKLRWADYGVEDPSIFIAKLKPDVTITFSVKLDADMPKESQDAKHS